MIDKGITRRHAVKIVGAAILVGSVPGCGTVASMGRVIIPVAWTTITQVVSCILRRSDKVLTLIALVESVQRRLTASLSSEEANALSGGGKLFIRTEDGIEHEISYTVG